MVELLKRFLVATAVILAFFAAFIVLIEFTDIVPADKEWDIYVLFMTPAGVWGLLYVIPPMAKWFFRRLKRVK